MRKYFRLLLAAFALALVAVPLSRLLVPVIVADKTLPQFSPHFRHYAAVWAYAVLALGVGLCLCFRSRRLFALIPTCLPRGLGWLGTVVLGQTLGAWLLAAGAAAAAAAFLVGKVGMGLPDSHALWVKLVLQADGAAPPAARLRYGPGPKDVSAFQWQPDATTTVAVRPLAGCDLPLRVLAVETDDGPVPLSGVSAAQDVPSLISPPTPEARAGQEGVTITRAEGGLLSWPRPSRRVSVTLGAGRGEAEALWLDQRTRVTLGPGPVEAALKLPGAFQGWALLPNREIRSLALEFPAAGEHGEVRRLEVCGDPPQVWCDGPDAEGAPTCVLPAAGPTGVVQLPGVRPINETAWARALLVWAGLTLGLLILLGASAWLAGRVRPILAARAAWESCRVVGSRNGPWSTGKIMLAVGAVTVAFHLTYALAVPVVYSADSVTYYRLGRALTHTPHFAALTESARTPGYPACIGMVLALFGEMPLGIVVFQHLALAALGPLTVWALARQAPPGAALAAGLLAGLSPGVSLAANVLWTESLFAVCMAATLLIYVRCHGRLRGLLAAGLFAGLATMVRPTGLLLLPLLLGWTLLRGWLDAPRGARQRLALAAAAALTAGYLVTAGPWHMHLFLVKKTTDLTQGLAAGTQWEADIYQLQDGPEIAINRPDCAIWTMPHVWGHNPNLVAIYFPAVAGRAGEQAQAYYQEGGAEIIRANPERRRENVRTALAYNFTLHWSHDPRFLCFDELSGFVSDQIKAQIGKGSQTTALPPPDAVPGQLRPYMVYRWYPERSAMRSLCMGMSKWVLTHWTWLAWAALFTPAVLLLQPRCHRLVPCWIFWMAIVASASMLGLPAERYVVVVEPLLYVLVVATLASVAGSCRAFLWGRRTENLITANPIQPQRAEAA